MNILHIAKAVETGPLERQHLLFDLSSRASRPDFRDESDGNIFHIFL